MKKWRVTPFLIAYPLVIILFIYSIYKGVWTAFSIYFIFGFIIFTSLIFFIERMIVKTKNIKRVWQVESIIIIISSLCYMVINCM